MAGLLKVLFPLLFAVLSTAVAQEHVYPPVCPDAERHDVCEIKIQRNDALDEIAIEKQKMAAMQQAEEKLAAWWGRYASGVARMSGLAEYWQGYAQGADKQVVMWKELCSRHHCSQAGF
jgi:hypothetical protein